MAIADRILPLTRLLLGAAYADNEVHDKEREEVRALLEDLAGELPTDVELEIVKFDPKAFDLALTAGEFVGDSEDDRKKLLFLVSAVIEADEEIDFSEDEYLRALAERVEAPRERARRTHGRRRDRGPEGDLSTGPQGSAAAAEIGEAVVRRRYGLT